MSRLTKRRPRRQRVGRVSYYAHHGGWWVYYQEAGHPVRKRVADTAAEAAVIAAQVNGQLAAASPTFFSFTPVSVVELRRRFLAHHEDILRSSLATVSRYSSATQHLADFSVQGQSSLMAHQIDAEGFVRFLRSLRVAPNGHAKAKRRKLRDSGVRFILETCRSLYGYAAKKRHLPPYADNPFAGVGGKRFNIEDAKRVFVFDDKLELDFLRAADDWAFPIQFTLAKTGLRPAELTHLLIDDLDLDAGWLQVRNKPELGWRIKTRRERAVPLIDEVVQVLRRVIGDRTAGPVFLQQKFDPKRSPLHGASFRQLVREAEKRVALAEAESQTPLTRRQINRLASSVWQSAGATKNDRIRSSFIHVAIACGIIDATCPKSWRHTFATLLQDGNVDPLIRQLTLGHAPTVGREGALGMTTVYSHSRPQTVKRQIERALRLWAESLTLARQWAQGGQS